MSSWHGNCRGKKTLHRMHNDVLQIVEQSCMQLSQPTKNVDMQPDKPHRQLMLLSCRHNASVSKHRNRGGVNALQATRSCGSERRQ